MATLFYIPFSNAQDFHSSYVLANTWFFVIFIMAIVIGVKSCGFNLPFPNDKKWCKEYSLVLIDHLSFTETCLFKSFDHLRIGLFVFCCCWRVEILHIFWTLISFVYRIYKYFLPLGGLPFHSLESILWCVRVFNFDETQSIYLFFCCLFFWYHIQEIIT